MPKHPNDAHMWAEFMGTLRDAGLSGAEELERTARRLTAIVRRERGKTGARTFGPGDEVPYDVSRVYDLDGDEWTRQGRPPSDLKDTWKMTGFNPDEHETAAQGAWITPWLLDSYGPCTEIPASGQKGGGNA
jgi:hypothetical protein